MRISDWSSDVCSSDLGLGVQALDVTLFGDFQRRVDEDLDELAVLEQLARHPPLCPERGNEADQHDQAGIDHEPRGLGYATDVFHPVLIGKTQVLVQPVPDVVAIQDVGRSEEHTSELQSLMRISYAVFCLKKTNTI